MGSPLHVEPGHAWQRFRGQGGRLSRRAADDRVTFPGGSFRIEGDVVRLARIGPMRLRRRGGNPYPDGVPKQVAVKRVGKRWHAVVCYEVEVGEQAGRRPGAGHRHERRAGDDQRRRHPAAAGVLQLMARHRRQQRVAARRRNRAGGCAWSGGRRGPPGSSPCGRTGSIAAGNRRVRGMTASARGTVEQPGTNVRQSVPG